MPEAADNDRVDLLSSAGKAGNETRAVLWFLVLAFGLSWALWSVAVIPGAPLHRGWPAMVLALGMWGPGLAALAVTRFVLCESWRTTSVDRLGRKRYYAWAWLLPAAGTLIAVGLTVLLGVADFDPELRELREMVEAAGISVPVPLGVLAALLTVLGVAAAPLVNGAFALGEEIGWRGFLLPRLMRAGLGQWQALILSGIVWGLWHAPVIARGHNYPGHPYLGILLMTVFCTLLGIIFGWLQLGSLSVWAPTVAHGAINGIAGLPVLILTPHDSALGGMLPSVIGWVPLAAFIAWLVWSGRLPVRAAEPPQASAPPC